MKAQLIRDEGFRLIRLIKNGDDTVAIAPDGRQHIVPKSMAELQISEKELRKNAATHFNNQREGMIFTEFNQILTLNQAVDVLQKIRDKIINDAKFNYGYVSEIDFLIEYQKHYRAVSSK